MRLTEVTIDGLGRFSSRQVLQVDGSVTALLGPNEAGKSTLLRHLDGLRVGRPFEPQDWHRGAEPTKRPIEAKHSVEAADRTALAAVPGADVIRFYLEWKGADGKRYHGVEPEPKRDISARMALPGALKRASLHRSLEGVDYRENLARLAESLEGAAETLPAEVLEEIGTVSELLQHSPPGPKAPKYIRGLESHLEALLTSERLEHPKKRALEILVHRCGECTLFDEEQRDLRPEYSISEHSTGPPAALRNLALLAELDLKRLSKAVNDGDFGLAERLLELANEQLRVRFRAAWQQSNVYLRLQRDGDLLRVLVNAAADVTYTAVAERSDGLRAFMALLLFTALRSSDRPTILLIDEAETHLHYDAQADLVRVLTNQRAASQVLYTTHSPGCLPQDLAAVRLLVSREDGTSYVANRFWTQAVGLSAMIIGMGATVAAFTPARFAVFGEGESDFILLPALLREATAAERLEFQVVAGLSIVSGADVPSLSLEAARVAHLVDGDKGGRAIRKLLVKQGVPLESIVVLGGEGSNVGLEECLRSEVYIEAVNNELSSGTDRLMPLSALRKNERSKAVSAWCTATGHRTPSKPDVAYQLLRMAADGRQLLSAHGAQHIRGAAAALNAALRVPS